MQVKTALARKACEFSTSSLSVVTGTAIKSTCVPSGYGPAIAFEITHRACHEWPCLIVLCAVPSALPQTSM